MTSPTLTLVAQPEVVVCPPDHRHAEATTCYHHHKCRCVPCVERMIARQADRRRLIAYGRWQPMVAATRARNHIRVLGATGIGYRRVAVLAHVSNDHVANIARGHTKRVSRALEARVLRIPVDKRLIAAGALVDPTITRRCIQALHARGWTAVGLAAELGLSGTNISHFRTSEHVTARTERRITELYERLWDAPPAGDERAQAQWRRRAAAAGWVPPLGWDDIYTDEEPPAVDGDIVDLVAVEFAVEGHRVDLTRDERHIALAQLHARGYNDPRLAQLLCVSVKTIERDREHLDLPSNYLLEREERSA